MQNYYSNGKLLLTGEYVVLDGALSLAIPTRYGQSLTIEPINDSKLIWECEANSHFEAMTKYYQFRGWGEYTSDYPEIDKRPYCE